MTVISEEKAKEIRGTMMSSRKSRYGVIRDLVNYGLSESDATDYVDKLASDIYQAPNAEERESIRDERIHQAEFGGYRKQMVGGLVLIGLSLVARFGLGFAPLYSTLIIIVGVLMFLYGLKIMLTGDEATH